MKTVYIVGGDGFARECYLNLSIIMGYTPDLLFGGFLGHGGYGAGVDYKSVRHLYKGEVSEHEFKDDEFVIIGAGYPELRKKIYTELKARNIKFYNLITYGSYVPESVKLGEANVIVNSVFSVDIEIGNCNVFNYQVSSGHDVKVGDFNFFGPRTQLLGNVSIGDFNQIGANTIILPKAKIGNGNKIAPLSAIYKGCKDNGYYQGNPAIRVGDVE